MMYTRVTLTVFLKTMEQNSDYQHHNPDINNHNAYLDHSSRTVSISEEAFEAENAHSNYDDDQDHSDNHTSYPRHSPSDFTLIQGFPTLAVTITLVAP